MADISDVSSSLVSRLAQILYPSGTSLPSVAGVPVMVYMGWPIKSVLDADLLAGKAHVSVFPMATERNTTRHLRRWKTLVPPVNTLAVAISGQTITISGTVATPQNVMTMVDKQPYVYTVQVGDTLTSIATGLAALIPGASSAGPVVTVSEASRLTVARIGSNGISVLEIRRQERVMMISVWTDTPGHRDSVAQPLDLALADLAFLTMPDQTAARLIYRGSRIDDAQQKAKLYRRDLLYSVEYGTTQIEVGTQITQTQLNVDSDVAGTGQFQPVATCFD